MMGTYGYGAIYVVLIWLVVASITLGAWVTFLIALWRGMKAHESIAESLKRMAENPKK